MYFLLLVMSEGCFFYNGISDNPFTESFGHAYLFADGKSAASRVSRVLQNFPSVKLCIPMSLDSVSSILLHDFYDYFGGILK